MNCRAFWSAILSTLCCTTWSRPRIWPGVFSPTGSVVHRFTLAELPQKIQHFAFIAGYTVRPIRESDPINQQAVEAIGDLHDKLQQDGYLGESLEVFLVRLLFCLFADSTGIFQPKDSFHDLVAFHTQEDGSDVGPMLVELFATLNRKTDTRQSRLAECFARFPYVNGKLFEAHYPAPAFDAAMRRQLLELCYLDWGSISPAIFGAMFRPSWNWMPPTGAANWVPTTPAKPIS